MPEQTSSGRGRDGPTSVSAWPRGWGATIRWYVHSVMGDAHYERYLAHHRLNHPDCTPLTKREYYRERTDRQDRNPGVRCC